MPLWSFLFQSTSTSYNYDFLPLRFYLKQFRGIYELTWIMHTSTHMRFIECFEVQDVIKQIDFGDFKTSVIYMHVVENIIFSVESSL